MEPTKKLRPYQVRLVTDVCRPTDDVLVEQPTGSGKSVQIVPQEQIEQGFVKRDYRVIAFPVCLGVAVPAIQVPMSRKE